MGDEINWDDSGWANIDNTAQAELDTYNQGSEEVQPWQNTENSGMNEVSDSSMGYSDTTEEVPSWANVSTTGNTTSGNMFNSSDLAKFFAGNPALAGIAKVFGSVAAGKLADKLFNVQGGPGGYKGGIPTLTANREMYSVPTTVQTASGQTAPRRPGSGGVTYFSPMQYLAPGQTPTPVPQPTQGGIANLPTTNRAPIQSEDKPVYGVPPPLSPAQEQQIQDMRSRNLPIDYFLKQQQPQQSPAQRVAENDAFYQSPEYKAFQNDPSNMMGTDDMYMSPYFGQQSSGSVGQAMDRAYEQYKGIAPRQSQSPAPFDLSSDFGNRFAAGGIANLGGYSDGGRLLRGPGDGVSDSIPAMIGKKQPARLADGEFVVPARIVSELGNGSTEAGARKLYAMMDRIKKARSKAKNIAADTKSDKHLPA
jgi:hypothetical protein